MTITSINELPTALSTFDHVRRKHGNDDSASPLHWLLCGSVILLLDDLHAEVVSIYAKKFGIGQCSFIGPGSEKKWYSMEENRPQGILGPYRGKDAGEIR